MERLNGLDLFSGIAGNTIGLCEYIKTIAYCENDRHAQSVLLSRMYAGDIEPAPIWDDCKTLSSKHFEGVRVDIIVGGFPCQDLSVAGKQEGIKAGNRSGLFFEIIRITNELKPKYVFLENVAAIRKNGLDIVCEEFTKIRYDMRWVTLSAGEIGAKHKRDRWFMLAIRRDEDGSNS